MLSNFTLTSLIFFHRGDAIPAYEFTHYPCAIEPLYIHGLDETQTYLHANGLYLYDDRVVYHLNPRITTFEIRNNSDSSVIGELHIRWKTDCDPRLTSVPSNTSSPITDGTTGSSSVHTSVVTSTSYPHTSTHPEKTTTAVLDDMDDAKKHPTKELYLEGIEKQVIYFNEPFNLLQHVYLRDEEGNDLSHRLSHSTFTNNKEGVYIVEVTGKVDDLIVRELMEVEVIRRDSMADNRPRSLQSYFFLVTSFILGGCIALWYHIRK